MYWFKKISRQQCCPFEFEKIRFNSLTLFLVKVKVARGPGGGHAKRGASRARPSVSGFSGCSYKGEQCGQCFWATVDGFAEKICTVKKIVSPVIFFFIILRTPNGTMELRQKPTAPFCTNVLPQSIQFLWKRLRKIGFLRCPILFQPVAPLSHFVHAPFCTSGRFILSPGLSQMVLWVVPLGKLSGLFSLLCSFCLFFSLVFFK